MKITKITENNEKYFDGVIGRLYESRTPDDLFVGAIDDDNAAVGAAAFRDMGEALLLRFIYVDEDSRREGYGRAMIDAVRSAMSGGFANRMFAYLFLSGNDDYAGLPEFLGALGFKMQLDDGRRNVYEYETIRGKIDFAHANKMPDGEVKNIKELSQNEIELVKKAYGDTEVLSPANVFGGVLFKKGKVAGALYVEPFLDGVRLSSLFSDGSATVNLAMLFSYALNEIEESGKDPQMLYVDAAGDSLRIFEDRFMEHMGIKPMQKMNSSAFVWEVDYE